MNTPILILNLSEKGIFHYPRFIDKSTEVLEIKLLRQNHTVQ